MRLKTCAIAVLYSSVILPVTLAQRTQDAPARLPNTLQFKKSPSRKELSFPFSFSTAVKFLGSKLSSVKKEIKDLPVKLPSNTTSQNNSTSGNTSTLQNASISSDIKSQITSKTESANIPSEIKDIFNKINLPPEVQSVFSAVVSSNETQVKEAVTSIIGSADLPPDVKQVITTVEDVHAGEEQSSLTSEAKTQINKLPIPEELKAIIQTADLPPEILQKIESLHAAGPETLSDLSPEALSEIEKLPLPERVKWTIASMDLPPEVIAEMAAIEEAHTSQEQSSLAHEAMLEIDKLPIPDEIKAAIDEKFASLNETAVGGEGSPEEGMSTIDSILTSINLPPELIAAVAAAAESTSDPEAPDQVNALGANEPSVAALDGEYYV